MIRDIRSVGGQNSDTRPDDIELAEEAKGSEVMINRKSNLDREVSEVSSILQWRWRRSETSSGVLQV